MQLGKTRVVALLAVVAIAASACGGSTATPPVAAPGATPGANPSI